MISPDGTRHQRDPPGPGQTTLVIMAAVVVVVGSLAVGRLTSPGDEPSDVLDQETTSEPLDWELSTDFDDIHPNTLLSHDGRLYLFGPATPPWAEVRGGLAAWTSEDGLDWDNRGQVLGPEAKINQVHSTPQGLIAVESGPGLHVWVSGNGENWERHEIPIDIDSPFVELDPTVAGGSDDVTVIAADLKVNGRRLLEEHLQVDLTALQWSTFYTRDDLNIVIHGPLGLPALETTASRLGLTRDERVWLNSGHVGPGQVRVWSRVSNSEWEPATIGGETIESLVAHPESGMLAFGVGGVVPTTWVSTDGVSWERLSVGTFARDVVRWGDRLAAVRRSEDPEVIVSADGRTWLNTHLGAHFDTSLTWEPSVLATGEGGLAVVVEGTANTRRGRPSTPTLTTADGATLRLNLQDGRYELDTGQTDRTWSMYSEDVPEGIDVDLVDRNVIFSDGATGSFEFGFGELIEAEASYWVGEQQGASSVVAFSPDGRTWSLEELGSAIGDNASIAHLQVTTEHVVALVRRSETRYEVWAAPVP